MESLKEKDISNVKRVKKLSVAFNKEEFIFCFNEIDDDIESSENFSIPISSMSKIVHGMIECGKFYEKEFQEDIGFSNFEG